MENKEIYIDCVDVSGCKNLMQGIVPFGCMEDRKTCSCMNNPNCLYKQLKRKEQECEELKKIINEAKNSKLDLKRQNEELQKENERLREEREKAKNYNLEYGQLLIKATNKNNKLSKTITEIKEIAKENIRIADLEGLNGVYRRGLATQILQKISELENE